MYKENIFQTGRNVTCRTTKLINMMQVQEVTNKSLGWTTELVKIKLNIKTLFSGMQRLFQELRLENQ